MKNAHTMVDKVGEEYGPGKDTIARLLRIHTLIPALKALVDNKTIAVRTAVNLSYLKPNHQEYVAELISEHGSSVDMHKSAVLKDFAQNGVLKKDMIERVLAGLFNQNAFPGKPKPKKIRIKPEIAEKYFQPDQSEDEIQDIIAAALEMYYKAVENK